MSLDARSREYREYVEAYLKDFYAQFHDAPQKDLYKAMEYSLLGGGKRLRPIFAFEFCRLCGRDWKDAAPFAAAVEMIHTYSLIHDDLPCMDNDDYRRGRLTNHKIFGEGMAVLAGDALLTDAFMVASKAKLARPEDMATAVGLMAECAGSPGMVGGQVLDIMSQEREPPAPWARLPAARRTSSLRPPVSSRRDWDWRSRFGTICWTSSAPSRSWEKPPAWMGKRIPSSACMVLKSAKNW